MTVVGLHMSDPRNTPEGDDPPSTLILGCTESLLWVASLICWNDAHLWPCCPMPNAKNRHERSGNLWNTWISSLPGPPALDHSLASLLACLTRGGGPCGKLAGIPGDFQRKIIKLGNGKPWVFNGFHPGNHCNNHGKLWTIATLAVENDHPVDLHQNLDPASTGQLHYALNFRLQISC